MVYLDGEIDRDAPRRLRAALDAVQRDLLYVVFNSPGGNLIAGMEIGRILRAAGASTNIGVRTADIQHPAVGICASSCALAFLGGNYRYAYKGSVYGVHRFSSSTGASASDLDVAQLLSSSVSSYMREMGIDPKLFDLMASAGPSQIRILPLEELTALKVINNGRMAPVWTIEVLSGADYLKGVQQTVFGEGKAIFFCDKGKVIFNSFYEAGAKTQSIAAGGWFHSLLVNETVIPLDSAGVVGKNGQINALFVLSSAQTQSIMNARSVGHAMQLARDAPTFVGYKVEVDPPSRRRVHDFLGNCITTK